MTYQIKCNGVPLCYMDDRKAAIKTLGSLHSRAITSGYGASLKAVMESSIEYVLTISNGMTFELRAS